MPCEGPVGWPAPRDFPQVRQRPAAAAPPASPAAGAFPSRVLQNAPGSAITVPIEPIPDRSKDGIETGGQWISPPALEDLISRHEAVSEAAVIGIAGEKWGERPPALVVPKKEWRGKLDENAVRDYCNNAAAVRPTACNEQGVAMNLEDAIKTALEYESRIRDLYRDGAASTPDPKGKRIFRELAEDEQRHVDYLQRKLDQWRRTGHITDEALESTIPPRALIQAEAEKLRERVQRDHRGLKAQMLSKALQVEIETSAFYRRMVDTLTEEGRGMFARFLEIENNHIDAVQFELDHIGTTGRWFGFEEFDMEEGGF